MSRALFGIETEYAAVFRGRNGAITSLEAGVRAMLEQAARIPSLIDGSGASGVFLANGSRFYIDSGMHPELAGPELGDPMDVVRYANAGDRIVQHFAEQSAVASQLSTADIYRCNVDHSGSGATWGCHESYLYTSNFERISAGILAHLISRIVYTGAGGLVNMSASIDFSVSPRVAHLRDTITNDSTSVRGIIHRKDEALASGPYHRLHLICGESLCSHLATYLKVGTTALVVMLADRDPAFGRDLTPQFPVEAMQSLQADPSCTRTIALTNGRQASALDIQRDYLEAVEREVATGRLPGWADEVCERWRTVLDALTSDPASTAGSLDWAIKLGLFRRHAEARGFTWSELRPWGMLMRSIHRKLETDSRHLNTESLVRAAVKLSKDEISYARWLKVHGLDLDRFREVLALRGELAEIDVRFGQLGPAGIFTQLDRAGLLDHRLASDAEIQTAIEAPPQSGARATARGRKIVELYPDRDRYRSDWSSIYDRTNGGSFDLSDPFHPAGTWKTGGRRMVGGVREMVSARGEDLDVPAYLRRWRARSGAERVTRGGAGAEGVEVATEE